MNPGISQSVCVICMMEWFFPEPENLYDWDPEESGRTFKGQPLEELARRWEVASKDTDTPFVA